MEIDLEKCLPETDRQQLKNRAQTLEGRGQKTDMKLTRQLHQEFQMENDDERGREKIMCNSDDDDTSSREEKKNRRELQFTIRGLKPGTRHSKVVISQLLLFCVIYVSCFS